MAKKHQKSVSEEQRDMAESVMPAEAEPLSLPPHKPYYGEPVPADQALESPEGTAVTSAPAVVRAPKKRRSTYAVLGFPKGGGAADQLWTGKSRRQAGRWIEESAGLLRRIYARLSVTQVRTIAALESGDKWTESAVRYPVQSGDNGLAQGG
jgi:hypothetical protein